MSTFPPRIPPELPELDRLIALLGTIAGGVTLSHLKQVEVRALAAGYPHGPAEAKRWKKALKELRAEVAAEPDPEACFSEGA